MSEKLLIFNKVRHHYEVIESVIIKSHEILNICKNVNLDIFIHLTVPNKSFTKYIEDKYPKIKFNKIENYDYYIDCTFTGDVSKLDDMPNSKKKYISHDINNKLKLNSNIYFLSPLAGKNFFYADHLPFSEKRDVNKNTPIYIVQGNLNHKRRNLSLIKKILDNKYSYNFKIKFVGRGHLPGELKKYRNRIILRNNLDFIDYHTEFLDAYCILPLITKKTKPQYYKNKITSTINYARGYKLKCLIDKDLQDIYNLDDVEVFNDINDITVAFNKTLKTFYNSNTKK